MVQNHLKTRKLIIKSYIKPVKSSEIHVFTSGFTFSRETHAASFFSKQNVARCHPYLEPYLFKAAAPHLFLPHHPHSFVATEW